MPSILETISAYFLYFLPSLILSLFVAMIGVVNYFFGKKKNHELMDNMFQDIQRNNKDRFTKIDLVEEGTMGRTYVAKTKEGQGLTNFRIHFVMVHRHLIISRIASYFFKRMDYVLLEADPISRTVKSYQLEIIPLRERKRIKTHSNMLFGLEPITVERFNLDKIFIFRVNEPELFKKAFQSERKIARTLYANRDAILRFSYYPRESPSIRLVAAEKNKQLKLKPLLNLIFGLTAEIATLGKKAYFIERRKDGIRISRDEKQEKYREKEDRKKFRV